METNKFFFFRSTITFAELFIDRLFFVFLFFTSEFMPPPRT